MKIKKLSVVAVCFLALVGFQGQAAETGLASSGVKMLAQASKSSVKRWYKFQHISQGAKIFQQNCATCHGKRAEGAPNWKVIGPDGKYPAPPLNGTGHAWHHPLKMLMQVIKNGSPGGQGNMPAWRDKLSDEEIIAAIAWFQSRWSREIYASWASRNDKKG